MSLTKKDLQAMRQTDGVSFHVYKGEGFIRLTKNHQHDIFAGEPGEYRIPTPYVFYDDSGTRSGGNSGREPAYSGAFYFIGSAKLDDEWQLLLRLIREGDTIEAVWRADAYGGGKPSNGYLGLASIEEATCRAEYEAREARRREWAAKAGEAYQSEQYYSLATPAGELHADALMLTVTRTTKAGKSDRFSIPVAVSICANNSARMIRP